VFSPVVAKNRRRFPFPHAFIHSGLPRQLQWTLFPGLGQGAIESAAGFWAVQCGGPGCTRATSRSPLRSPASMMSAVAQLVVVRNDGADGACFPIEVGVQPLVVWVLGLAHTAQPSAFLQSGEEISLGRDVSCDVRIRLPAVSRVHCKIIACDNKVRDREKRDGVAAAVGRS